MIKRYLDFINESLDFLLLESNVIFSDKFRRALTKIESPIAQKLLDIENKDLNTQSNYFDVQLSKNDTLSFTPDRKAQEILGDTKELYRFVGSGGGWLRHSEANRVLFDKLGYTFEEGTEPYKPNSRDIGEVLGKVTSEESGKVYFWIKWKGGMGTSQEGVDLGQGVYNQDKLTLIDSSEALLRQVWSKNRQEIKVGRAVRALINLTGEKFLDKDYEQFVNMFKSTIDKLNDKFSFFEVVSGSDIHYWYDNRKYFERKGTLGSSCMAGADESWLEIYTENPDQCQLVIFKSQDDENKIVGRALLWTLTDGKKFMDRIYTINDSDVNLFKDFAKENGWYTKYHNSSTDSGRAIAPDGSTVDLDLTVNLDKKNYRYYPYLDTLKYFREGSGILSNRKRNGDEITLEDTGGGHLGSCEYCGGSGRVECGDCYGRGQEECSSCDGDGEQDCYECDGEGDIDCSDCGGSGQIDGEEGEEDCETCGASGKVKCEDCSGGKVECSNCDGDGRVECSNCDGNGEVDCYECN